MTEVNAFPDSDSLIVHALGDFCSSFLRNGDRTPLVIRGYVNCVSKPGQADYILFTPMAMTRLATNRHNWNGAEGINFVTQPTQRRIQIDCYGSLAAIWAKTLSTLLRDSLACDFLATYGIAPLFVENPHDLTALEGDEQIHPRYMLGLMIQVDDTVNVSLDFFHMALMAAWPVFQFLGAIELFFITESGNLKWLAGFANLQTFVSAAVGGP